MDTDSTSPIHTPEQLGKALRARRKQLGWTQQELGRRAGVRQATISQLENGRAGTRLGTLFRIMDTLGLQQQVFPGQDGAAAAPADSTRPANPFGPPAAGSSDPAADAGPSGSAGGADSSEPADDAGPFGTGSLFGRAGLPDDSPAFAPLDEPLQVREPPPRRRAKPVRPPLQVCLGDRRLGELSWEGYGPSFRYAQSWLEQESPTPLSLSLPLRPEPHDGPQVRHFLENLLPENPGTLQSLARRWGAEGSDPYSLLARLGRDCAGAVRLLPEDEDPEQTTPVRGRLLSEAEIAARLHNLARAPLGLGAGEGFRMSLAGMQDKTALLSWGGQWYEPEGTTPTTHLLKPAMGGEAQSDLHASLKSVQNEYLCMKIAAAFGLDVAEVELASFEDVTVLVVERFDRRWVGRTRLVRTHHEDLCQALGLPPSRKYESDGGPGILRILELLRGSDAAEEDRRDFFAAQVLFWLLCATDGHAKNYSLHLLEGGRFLLAPFYDILSLQPVWHDRLLPDRDVVFSMALGTRRRYRMRNIRPRHFVQTAERAGIPRPQILQLLDSCHERGQAALEAVCNGLPRDFPAALVDSVARGMGVRLSALRKVA